MDERTDSIPDKELRIGLVLYGGVSLAIYIYGVVYEFLRLLRSYPSADSQGEGFRPESQAYRRVLELAHTRPVIDIISGSSAGGINGICLGVALATQGDLKPLETLWVKKGDLLELIDRKSSKPRSLLDSEHYVYLLEEALRSISATASPSAGPAPLLDVFVTATDLDGVTQTFGPPLTSREIEEWQYGTVFHLKVRPDRYALRDDTPGSDRQTVFDRLGLEEHLSRGRTGSNELSPGSPDRPNRGRRIGYLARLAASSSAFPVAFAPQVFTEDDKQECRELISERLFTDAPTGASVYGDGGIVDNKPFGYTIDAIFHRQADVQVDRKLFYVEPHPDDLGSGSARRLADARDPNGFDSLIAYVKARMHENITSDLAQVEERNKRIQHVRLAESLLTSEANPTAQAGNWRREDRARYEAYQKLKTTRLTDALRDRLAKLRDDGGFVEAVANRLAPTDTAEDRLAPFLDTFDVPFRVRRLRFFVKRINEALAGMAVSDAARRELLDIKADLYRLVEAYVHEEWRIWDGLRRAGDLDVEPTVERLTRDYESLTQSARPWLKAPDGPDMSLREAGRLLAEGVSHRLPGIPAGTFERFEYLDLHLYPLETLADVGEADPIEVVRVSPVDAETTGGRPGELLKGTKLFHFSAFMNEAWRVHDIRIGRLNTAEILVKTLLPERDEAKVLLDDLKKEIEGDADAARAADPHNPTLIYALLARTAGRLGTRVADRLRERGGIARLAIRPIHWFHRITEAIYYPVVILSAIPTKPRLRTVLMAVLVALAFALGVWSSDGVLSRSKSTWDWLIGVVASIASCAKA